MEYSRSEREEMGWEGGEKGRLALETCEEDDDGDWENEGGKCGVSERLFQVRKCSSFPFIFSKIMGYPSLKRICGDFVCGPFWDWEVGLEFGGVGGGKGWCWWGWG